MKAPSFPTANTTYAKGLHGLCKAYFAAHKSLQQKTLVYVTHSPQAAQQAVQNLKFLLAASKAPIVHLPLNEQNPYHLSSPDPFIVMERLSTLQHIAVGEPFSILVTSVQALASQQLSFSNFQERHLHFAIGENYERQALLKQLALIGYSQVNTVEDTGTFAIRGSVLDIYWPGLKDPIRLDFFGDTLESISLFSTSNQRNTGKLDLVMIGPVREIFLDDAAISLAQERLRNLADEVEYPTKKLNEKLHDIKNRIPFFGIESLLPAFHHALESPLTLLEKACGTKNLHIVIDDQEACLQSLKAHQDDLDAAYKNALVRGDLCFPPQAFYAPQELLLEQLAAFETTVLLSEASSYAHAKISVHHSRSTEDLRQDILRQTTRIDTDEGQHHAHFLLAPLASRLKQARQDGYSVFLPVTGTAGTLRLKELLEPHGIHIRPLKTAPSLLHDLTAFKEASVHAYTYVATPYAPAEGMDYTDIKLLVFAEDDIFGKRTKRDGGSGKKKGFSTSISDLERDDFIVHVDHGVGIYKGLAKLSVRGVEQDYVLLYFAGDDKLYLPVHRINLIQRYSGAEAKAPRLDKLGGPGWQSKKKKVKEATMAMAQELLNLYAKRELVKRPSFPAPNELYFEFESRFGFDTTSDQQKAIDDIIADMQKAKPMDRLICGDVGYGKTEVAMRAAMLAVIGGSQVAVLAPTTILAQQHAMSFSERFSHSGVSVGVVSRFQSSAEVRETLKKSKEGKLDILIGTHRILSDDVAFKQLGLVIVDEEQRFGIKAKEQLKRLRANVDFVAMSATPIPRTLQMGFFGIRDMSIIETPPVDRRAIRTEIIRFDDALIREAMMRELARSGQIYFVHNRVSSIQATADYIRKLIPEAKVEVGHGQMNESALEDVMLRFMRHEFNVLVCTTIIETGIDVSSANTMFIDNADDFGLAQLYQLRGRIGRSKERAFAYLVIPSSTDMLTPIAKKRLEILHRFSELGAGFRIAQHDLELRGAGDLLGKSQHGHVAVVGFDLYTELLKEAVEELRGRVHEDIPDPDVSLPVAAMIPDKYCPDMGERLGFYQRLATAVDKDAVWEAIGAMADLLGDPPPEALALAEVMLLKQELRTIAARAIELLPPDDKNPLPRVVVSLGENARLHPGKLTVFVEDKRQHVILTPKMKLIYTPSKQEWEIGNLCNLFSLGKAVVREIRQYCGIHQET